MDGEQIKRTKRHGKGYVDICQWATHTEERMEGQRTGGRKDELLSVVGPLSLLLVVLPHTHHPLRAPSGIKTLPSSEEDICQYFTFPLIYLAI